MKFNSASLSAFFCLMFVATVTPANVIVLKPGASVTISFDDLRRREKGTPPLALLGIGATATLSLDEGGTVLTITLKNASLINRGAALYALDLALPHKLVNETRISASFSGFTGGANWVGPLDKAELGSFVFAARESVLRRLDDFLSTQTALPAGFLQAGQQGQITITLALPPPARGPLRLNPVAYFLLPDPQAPLEKRLALVAINGQRTN